MIKVVWCRFQQCLGTFTRCLVEESSQTRLFRHWSKHVFGVRNFENKKAMRVIFFFQTFEISVRFQKCRKKRTKIFCFWDICILIGIVKLSLLRTRYFSSAANVLSSSHRFYISIKETFSKSIFLPTTNEYHKGTLMQISTVLVHVYHIAFRSVLWNGNFQTFIRLRFWGHLLFQNN